MMNQDMIAKIGDKIMKGLESLYLVVHSLDIFILGHLARLIIANASFTRKNRSGRP